MDLERGIRSAWAVLALVAGAQGVAACASGGDQGSGGVGSGGANASGGAGGSGNGAADSSGGVGGTGRASGGSTAGGGMSGSGNGGVSGSAGASGDGATSGGTSGNGGTDGSGGTKTSGGASASGGLNASGGGGGRLGEGGLAGAGQGGKGGAAAGGATTGGSGGGAGAVCLTFKAPSAVGKAQAAALGTLSGMVASRTQPGVLFAHADHSGARFFALDESGATLSEFTLSGAKTTDWEDVAVGPGPKSGSHLYFGDVGDNAARPGTGSGRMEIQVFRLLEPTVTLTQKGSSVALADWELLHFTYPDRPHDCEALMVDPDNGDLYFLSREQGGSAVLFRSPGKGAAGSTAVLERLVELQVGAVGANAADIAPGGDRALVRTYEAVLLYARAPSATWAATFALAPRSLPAADETQSEAITFGADGRSYFSSGEGDPVIFEALADCP